ncbi:TRF5, partial [Acrasis kona]
KQLQSNVEHAKPITCDHEQSSDENEKIIQFVKPSPPDLTTPGIRGILMELVGNNQTNSSTVIKNLFEAKYKIKFKKASKLSFPQFVKQHCSDVLMIEKDHISKIGQPQSKLSLDRVKQELSKMIGTNCSYNYLLNTFQSRHGNFRSLTGMKLKPFLQIHFNNLVFEKDTIKVGPIQESIPQPTESIQDSTPQPTKQPKKPKKPKKSKPKKKAPAVWKPVPVNPQLEERIRVIIFDFVGDRIVTSVQVMEELEKHKLSNLRQLTNYKLRRFIKVRCPLLFYQDGCIQRSGQQIDGLKWEIEQLQDELKNIVGEDVLSFSSIGEKFKERNKIAFGLASPDPDMNKFIKSTCKGLLKVCKMGYPYSEGNKLSEYVMKDSNSKVVNREYLSLSEEQVWEWTKKILEFEKMQVKSDERKQEYAEALMNATAICKKVDPLCQVKVFGSYATDLGLLNHDIDIHVKSNVQPFLDRCKKQASEKKLYKQLIVIGARVPICKLVTNSNIQLDVSIKNKEDDVEVFNQFKKDYPQLKPLCIILKQMLNKHGKKSNDGGITSCTLQYLVVSHLQNYENNFKRPLNGTLLGQLFYDFMYFYSVMFKWQKKAICVRTSSYVPVTRQFKLIVDPVNLRREVMATGRKYCQRFLCQRFYAIQRNLIQSHGSLLDGIID